MRRTSIAVVGVSLTTMAMAQTTPTNAVKPVLEAERFRACVETFNRQDEELYPQHIPNAAAWPFLAANIPLFECPDKELQLTYYFRWWTYRKHSKKTPEGFVITEFLPPVRWAGKYNTVNFTAWRWMRS